MAKIIIMTRISLVSPNRKFFNTMQMLNPYSFFVQRMFDLNNLNFEC